MEEKAQGAAEYLLMLAAALTVVAAIVALTMETFGTLGSSVRDQISITEEELIEELAGA